MITLVKLKRKKENKMIQKTFERSSSGEVKGLEAKRVKLLNDFINKETWKYLYVCYRVNANTLFSQDEQPNFGVFYQYINTAANDVLPNPYDTIQSQVIWVIFKTKTACFFYAIVNSLINLYHLWLLDHHESFWRIRCSWSFHIQENITLRLAAFGVWTKQVTFWTKSILFCPKNPYVI